MKWNVTVFLTARITTLTEHQDQMNEALAAYDEALDKGDPSQLSDGLLLTIPAVATDSDILLSPSSDASKVNGVNFSLKSRLESINYWSL